MDVEESINSINNSSRSIIYNINALFYKMIYIYSIRFRWNRRLHERYSDVADTSTQEEAVEDWSGDVGIQTTA